MSGLRFAFHGLRLEARATGALWWPEGQALLVADLHLGKSERMARRGGPLLPPYDAIETLERLGREIAALQPRLVISLGDGFDDLDAARALDAGIMSELDRLGTGRDWIWISGNHDPADPGGLHGRVLGQMLLGQVVLRHAAAPDAAPDVSGHFHPVIRLAGERRRAFLLGANHLILPAFGAYTGGLPCDDPALARLVPRGLAIACGRQVIAVPVGDPVARQRKRGARRAPLMTSIRVDQKR